jgi:hypothetical protein
VKSSKSSKLKTALEKFYFCVSLHHKSILYKEPTGCNFGRSGTQYTPQQETIFNNIAAQ